MRLKQLFKRSIATLCCVIYLISLSACSKNEDGTEAKTPEPTQAGDIQTGENTTPEELVLPLSDKEASLDIWMEWSSDYITSPDEIPVMQEMEKKTGVDINWTTVTSNEYQEKFNLLMVSGGIFPYRVNGRKII